MTDLRELYQEVIIDHSRSPRNFRSVANATYSAEGYNPLCGDKLELYVVVDAHCIRDIAFIGEGCAISTASASLLTETLKGKTIAEARELFTNFHRSLTQEGIKLDLGKLNTLAGVKEFPMRVKCATLAWHTLQAALDGKNSTSTE